MMQKIVLLCLITICLLLFTFVIVREPASYSQPEAAQRNSERELDIDMFIAHWKDSDPRYLYGSLEVRDILTKCHGDPLHPTEKGAVLTDINSVSFATLKKNKSTQLVCVKD